MLFIVLISKYSETEKEESKYDTKYGGQDIPIDWIS